jgi:hypothetical protein
VTPARWHFGRRFPAKRALWVNLWVTNPCADLAIAFELGARAAHYPS